MTDLKKEIYEARDKLSNEAYTYYQNFVGEIPFTLSNGKLVRDTHNSEVDAFRHAYAAGVIAMEYGEVASNILGQSYEVKNDYDNYRQPSDKQASPEQATREKGMDFMEFEIGGNESHF